MSSVMPPAPVADEIFYSEYFDFLLELAQCVESRGYLVPDSPSKAAFVDSSGAAWHPFQNLDSLTREEMVDLEEICPQDFRGYCTRQNGPEFALESGH